MTTQTKPSNLDLIGGEMLGYSDSDGSGGAAGGPALAYLAGAAIPARARVLIAGPHDDDLVRAILARGAQVTCLLRAYTDAEVVATAFPKVTVLAGSLTKLNIDESYDVVVALDGCARLCSVEGRQLTWAECVDALGAAVAPTGALLLAVANPLGIDRLVALPDAEHLRTVSRYDGTAPFSADEIGAGIGPDRTIAALYAAYPLPSSPSLLIRTDVATRDARAVYATLAAAACAQGFAERPVLTDPRAIAATAVRAGASAQLAPTWIVAITAAGQQASALPATVVADRPADPGFAAVYELVANEHPVNVANEHPVNQALAGPPLSNQRVTDRPSAGQPGAGQPGAGQPSAVGAETGNPLVRRPVAAPSYTSGSLTRDVGRLSGTVPAGRMLDELLLTTASRLEAPALRQALHGYVTWLATLDDPVVAVPGNVVVSGDAYTLLDPSWTWTAAVRTDVARARALRLIAVELVGSGSRHPWSATADVDELTVLLSAAAGSSVDPAAIAAAVDLDVEVRAARGGLDQAAKDALHAEITAVRPAMPRVDLDGYRELQAALLREQREVARLEAVTAWNERNISMLEDALRRSERQVALFSGSVGYRSAKLVVATAKRGLQPVKRQVKNIIGR